MSVDRLQTDKEEQRKKFMAKIAQQEATIKTQQDQLELTNSTIPMLTASSKEQFEKVIDFGTKNDELKRQLHTLQATLRNQEQQADANRTSLHSQLTRMSEEVAREKKSQEELRKNIETLEQDILSKGWWSSSISRSVRFMVLTIWFDFLISRGVFCCVNRS